ncbi:MAG: hypothetical protein II206_11095, partial [Bacteroidaceae bacterium]|nr:hypothetical protein [Bacteroidaceae bacterium]
MDERNDAVRTQEEDRVTTPYCFVAAMYEGQAEAYVDRLDYLETLLENLEKEQGGKIGVNDFTLMIPKGFTKEALGRKILFDMVVYFAVNGLHGKQVYASTCLKVLRECVTTPPPEGTAEHYQGHGELVDEDEEPQELERFSVVRIKQLLYPLDKVNSKIWSLSEEDTREERRIGVEKRGSKKGIDILYSINFDELDKSLQISKRLTQYDKRVYVAIAGLFNGGNSVITLRQIHEAMGNTGKPSKTQREKISMAVTKMQSAMIRVDNSAEASKYDYEEFVYSGSLLPIERVKRLVNGNLMDEAIHLFREPPVMTFARERKQITTVPVQLLNSPISKTDANLAIEDYLLERISRAGKGRSSCKILYKTICEKAGANTSKEQQRVPEKVIRYLT